MCDEFCCCDTDKLVEPVAPVIGYVVKIALRMNTIEVSSEQPLVSSTNSSNFMLAIRTISFLWVTHISTNLSNTGNNFRIVVYGSSNRWY